MIRLFTKNKTGSWFRHWTSDGVIISARHSSSGLAIEATETDAYLAQLIDDGLTDATDTQALISWDNIYRLAAQDGNRGFYEVLRLPPRNTTRPILRSSGSYTDPTFAVFLAGWRDESGAIIEWEATGAVLAAEGRQCLMTSVQWNLISAIRQFADRAPSERDDDANRLRWGKIRQIALKAEAHLDDFLYRSVVLTPEKLQIEMRRSDTVADDRVVELVPTFVGAPPNWLQTFDSIREVPRRYDIVTHEGIVQVLITPEVRTVLQEIRRLPGRRVAGSRAQAFIVNPFGALGPDAASVIDESEFEAARRSAGLRYERFVPKFERSIDGYPQRVGVLIESAVASGPTTSELHWLDEGRLEDFVTSLEQALRLGNQLVAFEGFDLELSGEAEGYLLDLRAAQETRRTPQLLVTHAQVHDLSAYSIRIEGIGTEKRYYSPYIAKRKEGDGWFPENVVPMVVFQPDGESEPIAVPTTRDAIKDLKGRLDASLASGQPNVSVSWLKRPLSIDDAKDIVDTFASAFKEIEKGTFTPEKRPLSSPPKVKPKALLLRANIQSLDYEERRRQALGEVPELPRLPSSLKDGVQLLPHQLEGLAWLQHLYSIHAEYQVRGGVLADDMGLGKTLQLLCLIAWLFETEPKANPALVVAPLSLLENWTAEIQRFFKPDALPVLTAYGASLTPLRLSREQIDRRLQSEDGLVKFLRPAWVGNAKVVLTTYETLRDLEFSFAAERWSLMVCDEAQKIKNPAAMVTRAAKKQNVALKIACTGTPVENTLADLWCLFDYVQPGLLGALNDFGQRYRRPIEAKTDEELARVDELRARIEPQILRRMKADVAKDLPKKVVVEACRRLPLSAMQRTLYSHAVTSFKNRGQPGHFSPFKNHLGLLHYLRLICTDPKPHGLSVFKAQTLESYRKTAPKLDWLLGQLVTIKKKNEKAIVFCEFREIQRLLRHYIEEALGFTADIINGDSSASTTQANSRQKRIEAFQAVPGFGVIILSPLAVGFGVNIQGANHVIHYTRTWNPAKEDQATDRAYRIGQEKDVYVYYPVVNAEDFTTFDVKLDQLLNHKRKLADDMLNGSGDIAPGDFELADVVPPVDGERLDTRISIEDAVQMDWQHFECLAGVLWTKKGFSCYRTPASGDNGVDVVARAGDEGVLIQTKTASRDGQKLGWEAVKDVVTGAAFYSTQHPDVRFEKACLTNQFFNEQAKHNAELNSVKLYDRDQLAQLLERHPVTMLEVEKMRYAQWDEAA